MDPTTVLSSVVTGLSKLQVNNSAAVSSVSEPTTPSESPQSLDSGLRDWLTETLSIAATNPKVYTKILVSNAAAGSVIGKGGGNINDFQAKTYARIQLSKAQEYFPGTAERTLLVTGRLKQVIAALSLILAKLVREGVAPLSPKSKPPPGPAAASEPPRLLLKLLVPQPLCGIIIGKSGVTIRNCAQETRTAIRVNAVEGAGPLSEAYRVVTVAGPQECVLKAIALLVLKQSEDQKFPLFAELPSAAHVPMGMHPGMAGVPPHMLHAMGGPAGYGLPRGGMPYVQMGPGGGMYGPPGGAMYGPHGGGMAGYRGGGGGRGPQGDSFTSLTLTLSDEQAALLLGKGERGGLEDVQQMSGARVRVETREVEEGEESVRVRQVVLGGPVETVQLAQWLLGQKLAAAIAMQNGGYPSPMQEIGGTTYYQSNYHPGVFHGAGGYPVMGGMQMGMGGPAFIPQPMLLPTEEEVVLQQRGGDAQH